MTLAKDHIAGSLLSRLGVSKPESSHLLESVLELIKRSLASGDDVLLSDFGKFIVRQKAARQGRDTATGEDMNLAPRKVVTFKCSALLNEKLNGKAGTVA